MSRIRLLVLAAVVASFALVATSASAQAHEYIVGGKALSGSKALAANEESVIKQELSGTPFGVAVHVNCSHVRTTGSITGPAAGKATLEFSACEATKPANCTVKEPIVTSVSTSLAGPSPGVEVEFKPEVGETFTTVTLQGASCSLTEPFEVKGAQTCKLPGGETEAATHEISCETSGSKLKAGGKAATFKGGVKALALESGEGWKAL